MKGKVGGQWNKIFRSMLITWFLSFFSGVLDWIVLILVWFERSLHSAQVSGQSCPWPLKLMTSQRVQRTWICRGGYRQFRGEWVKLYTYFLLELFFSNFQNGPFSLIHWFLLILHGEQSLTWLEIPGLPHILTLSLYNLRTFAKIFCFFVHFAVCSGKF